MILLGDKIKELRIEARYTQEELARRLNVTKASISAYERNARQPSLDVVISIARVFNVSTDYLLLSKSNMIVEVTGLDSDQRKSVRELANLYRTINRYNAYLQKNHLVKDFEKSSKTTK